MARRIGCGLRFGAIALVAACNVYDPSLLGEAPSPNESGMGGEDSGANGSGGSPPDTGGAAGTAGGSGGLGGLGGTAGAPDAGAGGGSGDAGLDVQPPCTPLDAPRRTFGAPTGGVTAIYAALSSLDLGDDPDTPASTRHRSHGYDLDATCSPAGSSACGAPAWPAAFEADGADGIDATAGALFERFSDLVPALRSSGYTERIRESRGTLFLSVDGYNGETEDGLVGVSLARTLPHGAPAWAGIDEWVLAADDHDGELARPRYRDDQAYVAGSSLVAHFASARLRLPNPDAVPLDIELARAVLSCRVEPQSGVQPFRLTGCILAGAWYYRDALAALEAFPVPAFGAGGPPFCRDDVAYAGFRELVCGSVDLTLVAGSTASCDALSFALRFDTVPAFPNTQTLEPLPPPPERCGPPVDPADDDCA